MTLPMPSQDGGPVVQSFVIRPDGAIQIDWYDPAESSPQAIHLHSHVTDASVITNLDDIVEDIQEALRDVQVHIRHAAATRSQGTGQGDVD